MTVLSRGARKRRGGRRPGWLLLTVLLVLAIAASSALVFTSRVELLKLAVILSLWAAVVAAFVSVIYRRQSDIDQARARDLKLVYDLQLDREISARREYELTVESHLRRELASELRAQAADEVAALRADLAALRANLEILFDADLGERPALEGDRSAGGGYGDWSRDTTSMPPAPGRVHSSRITPVSSEDTGTRTTADNPIIDVHEEPLVPPTRYAPPPPQPRPADAYPVAGYRSAHRRSPDSGEPAAGAHERPFAPPPPPPAPPARPTPGPVPHPAPEPAARHAPRPESIAESQGWKRVEAEGLWLPPGTQGGNRVAAPVDNGAAATPAPPTPEEPPRGRHWTSPEGRPPAPEPAGQHPPEPVMQPPPQPAPPHTRHSAEEPASGGSAPAMSTAPPPESAARHRGADEPEGSQGQHTGGQSVAELMARLQANGSMGGGRRRRRED